MSKAWYYARDGVQNGPVGTDELRALQSAGQIPAGTLIWHEGMDKWKYWQEIPELAAGAAAPAAVGGGGVYAPPAANPMPGAGMHSKPPTYLWQSIVCTLLCCLPFGVVGIVFAAKVDGLSQSGNATAALEASDKAKFWCWMSFGFGLGIFVIGLASGMMGA